MKPGILGTGITVRCKLPYRCWKPNLGPLQGKYVFITTSLSLKAHSPELASGHGVFHSNRKQTRTKIMFIYPLSLWNLA